MSSNSSKLCHQSLTVPCSSLAFGEMSLSSPLYSHYVFWFQNLLHFYNSLLSGSPGALSVNYIVSLENILFWGQVGDILSPAGSFWERISILCKSMAEIPLGAFSSWLDPSTFCSHVSGKAVCESCRLGCKSVLQCWKEYSYPYGKYLIWLCL